MVDIASYQYSGRDFHKLQPYAMDGKPHITIGDVDGSIKLMDLTSYKVTTLTDDDYINSSLTIYEDNAVPMLVSSSNYGTIKILYLSHKTNIATFDCYFRGIWLLATWK